MTTLRPIAPATAARPSVTVRRWIAPASAALVGFLVTFAVSWVPSVWFDEAATISAATRSWPELFRMLGGIDAVHGVYYAGMHVWFDLVGYSPTTLRLPSAAATGIAAGLLLILVRRFGPERLAIISTALFLLLPRVTWMGGEGRSYAAQTALAVALTLVFLGAWRRAAEPTRTRMLWWGAYAALGILASWTFLYLALVVAAHAVTAIVSTVRGRRLQRRSLVGFGAAAVLIAIAAIPLVRLARHQSAQVSWIDPIDGRIFHGVFVSQWFILNDVFAVPGCLLLAIGAVLLVRRRRARGSSRIELGAAAVILPWVIVPTLGLIAVSLLVDPLYTPRYLTFTTPAVAVLMAVAVTSVRRWWMAAGILLLCAALSVPSHIGQRQPLSKQNTAWNQVAELVATERASEPAGTTDAVIWGPLRQHRTATSRVIEYAYPAAFAGTVDVKLAKTGAENGTLWETSQPLSEVTDRFADSSIAWLITSDKQDWRPSVAEKLAALGFHVDQEWHIGSTNVVRYQR